MLNLQAVLFVLTCFMLHESQWVASVRMSPSCIEVDTVILAWYNSGFMTLSAIFILVCLTGKLSLSGWPYYMRCMLIEILERLHGEMHDFFRYWATFSFFFIFFFFSFFFFFLMTCRWAYGQYISACSFVDSVLYGPKLFYIGNRCFIGFA